MASVEHNVLLSRGSWFKADSSAVMEKMFFRATYAAASSDKIDEAISRFAVCLKEQFGL